MCNHAETNRVEVALFASLSKYNPEGTGNAPFSLEIQPGCTVEEILKGLGLSADGKLIYVDEQRNDKTFVPPAGAKIAVFPPITGG